MSLIRAEKITYSIDELTLLNNVNLDLMSGEIVGLIGPNGAGKSTLLKLLARLLKPDSGSLTLGAKPYENFSAQDFSQQVSYLEQETTLSWSLTVEQLVKLGRLPHRQTGKENAFVEKAIEQCGISQWRQRHVNSLSAGEKALVNLARCVATEPKLILADEPAAALDLHHQLFLMELLSKQKENCSSLVVMHDLNLAAKFCDRLLLMSEGNIVSTGSAKEVLNTENLRNYFKIESRVIETSNGIYIEVLGRN